MKSSTPTPIIIKKVVKGGHGHHGGSWKVAYADFVTAMMALFIVLWVLAQNDKAKEAVAIYFTDPSMTPEEIKMKLEHPAIPNSKEKPEVIKKKLMFIAHSADKKKLEELAKKLRADLGKLHWSDSLKGQLVIEMTEEGLRIEFLDLDRSPFFDVGSAQPRDYTRQVLQVIGKELALVPNPLAIEGHTDSRPFYNRGYGNWELSADRANAARRILESGGVRRDQICEVRGLADTRLRRPSDPMADSNRRVSVIVRFMDIPATPTSPGEKAAEEAKAAPGDAHGTEQSPAAGESHGGGEEHPSATPAPIGLDGGGHAEGSEH